MNTFISRLWVTRNFTKQRDITLAKKLRLG